MSLGGEGRICGDIVSKNSVNGFIFTPPCPHFNVNAKGYELLTEAAGATQSQLVSELSLSMLFVFFFFK